MELKAYTTSTYSLNDLKSALEEYNREHLLRFISFYLTAKYHDDQTVYKTLSQLSVRIYNGILLFAKGGREDFDEEKLVALLEVVSSLEFDADFIDPHIYTHQALFQINTHESPAYVFGRIFFLSKWLEEHSSKLNFEKVTGINLEMFMYLLLGSSAIVRSYDVLPGVHVEGFLRDLPRSSFLEKDCVELLRKRLSITIEEAEQVLQSRLLETGRSFDECFNVFTERFFIDLDGFFLLTLPHMVNNSLISVWSRFFIASFSEKANNDASTALGEAFEDYVFEIAMEQFKNLKREPVYCGSQNKGVDLVSFRKGKVPVLIEVHKSTVYKSLAFSYSQKGFEGFIIKKILPKFEQMFKWLKSHDYKYGEVDVLKDLKRTQFILVIAEEIPIIHMDDPFKTLMYLVNESWSKITSLNCALRPKNIYVIGIETFEHLMGVTRKRSLNPSLLLFDYKKYFSKTKEMELKGSSVQLRGSLKEFLDSEYDLGSCENDIVLNFGESLVHELNTKFKA